MKKINKKGVKQNNNQKQLVSIALIASLLIVVVAGIIAFNKPLASEKYSSPDIPASTIQFSPEEDSQIVQNTLGFDPSNPGEKIEDIRNRYLTQEWSKIIAEKPVIGAIHTFFLAHPLPFKILFNYPYTFSPTFLLIVVLWIYFIFIVKDIMSFTAYDDKIGWIVGILSPIFLAHIGFLNIVSSFFVDLVISKDKWWIRWIIGILLTIGMVILYKLEGVISKAIAHAREQDRMYELQAKVAKSDEFRKGFQQGQGI